MKRTRPRPYKTLKGLTAQLLYNHLTAEGMANKRAYFKDGWWYDFKISQEAEDEFWNGMAHVVWRRPSERQIRNLRYAKSWMLQRLMFSDGRYSYCAGQDYPAEIRTIQNYVNKN